MDSLTRISEIEKITSNIKNEIAVIEVYWKNQLNKFPVYKVPLSILLYNPYNGRIASSVKTLERHRGEPMEISDSNHQEVIGKLIWDSKINSNKKTFENIKERGQMLPATITKDGVLIDGNRRAMLLNKLGETYIKTIVLPVTLEEDPIAIQELEYEYQIAVDEKVDYNPVEKYIKANDLYFRYKERGVFEKKILSDLSKLNGFGQNNISKVRELLETYDLMVDYLKSIDADGYLILLEKKEDLFLQLRGWLNIFLNEDGSNKESLKGFDGYDEFDVADLKDLSFDYIRTEIEGKSFRFIATGNRGSHIFSVKTLWTEFWQEHIDIIRKGEFDFEINENSEIYIEELRAKNKEFKIAYHEKLSANLDKYAIRLKERKWNQEPLKRLDNFLEHLDDNSLKKKIYSSDNTEPTQQLKDIVVKSVSLLNRSPLKQIESMLDLVDKIDLNYLKDDERVDFENTLKQLNQRLYQIKKKF
jgi:hypothetical protein